MGYPRQRSLSSLMRAAGMAPSPSVNCSDPTEMQSVLNTMRIVLVLAPWGPLLGAAASNDWAAGDLLQV